MPLKKKYDHAGQSRAIISTPLGFLEIVAGAGALQELHFVQKKSGVGSLTASSALVFDCCRQLEEYFSGKRRRFDLALSLGGTEFERDVWRHLLRIPYGRTASYGEIAAAIGRPKAVRAVGAANGKNPVAIIVPCHRVVGHDGRLTGYGGGLWRKKWLLDHERRHISKSHFPPF
jgi:methylated-DNA-[protein]-cysteine S-methyltransferase